MATTDGPTLDAWTLAHIGAGAVLGALKVGPVWTLAALVGFELFEAHLRGQRLGDGLWAPETRANVLADLAAGAAGWAALRALKAVR